MKKLVVVFFVAFVALVAKAQIPNFGTTAGDQKLYGYSSMKYRAKAKTWETYSTLQYGVTDNMNFGVDLYTSGSSTYLGYIFRTGTKVSPYFSIGAQLTP